MKKPQGVLIESTLRWKKTQDGYRALVGGREVGVLRREGRHWFLDTADREPIDLGKRASLDHAEGALRELGLA